MVEIYQEKLSDLLVADGKDKLFIRETNGKTEIAKLTVHSIRNAADAQSLFEIAAAKRSKSHTALNSGSSRSHAVYSLCYKNTNKESNAVFQIVDLAGSGTFVIATTKYISKLNFNIRTKP